MEFDRTARIGVAQLFRKSGDDFRQIVLANKLEDILADQLFRLVAEEALDRRALVAYPPALVQDRDDVGSVFDERAEMFFATPESLSRPLTLDDSSELCADVSHHFQERLVGLARFVREEFQHGDHFRPDQ